LHLSTCTTVCVFVVTCSLVWTLKNLEYPKVSYKCFWEIC
jgi:hypothetical protein